jgi:hypothetical protein
MALQALSSFPASQAITGAESGSMLTASPPTRTIEEVPTLFVNLLHDCGKLPKSSREPDPNGLGFRKPTLEDAAKFVWLCAWEGHRVDEHGFRNVAGVAAYRDVYDYHSYAEVRECVSLGGSPRACFELVDYMRSKALMKNRRFIGTFDLDNEQLREALERTGLRVSRITMENA